MRKSFEQKEKDFKQKFGEFPAVLMVHELNDSEQVVEDHVDYGVCLCMGYREASHEEVAGYLKQRAKRTNAN